MIDTYLGFIAMLPIAETKRPPGTPPGVIKNPKGNNQYTANGLEQRGKSFGLRLPLSLDIRFREAIEHRGITATTALTEAVELWLKNLGL